MNDRSLKIAFFEAKPYDRRSFDQANEAFNFDITCFDTDVRKPVPRTRPRVNPVFAWQMRILKPVIIDLERREWRS
jgi:hypothetical protein